jgi:acyl carrier protein
MSGDINFEEVKKDVKKIASKITEISEEELSDDAVFTDDLGIDSMMALEIVASIEKKYKVRIAEEEIPAIRSLQNVYDLLEKLLKK